jgi:hypothetical protein
MNLLHKAIDGLPLAAFKNAAASIGHAMEL